MSSRGTGMPAIAVPVRLSDGDVGDADPRVGGANKIFADVVDLVRAAGAEPVLVGSGTEEETERLLDGCQGFLVPGGGDVDPALYGGAVDHPALYDVNREQDRLDLAVIRHARRTGRPYLGICRGMQLLNVARGGTLHQHLPDVVGERITHRQSEVGERPTHWVTLAASSRVSRILVRQRTKVNSFHHQAIATLGAGLAVTGRASDGTIECVEAVDRDFVVGVQWHAECLVDRFGVNALFRAFVEASSQFEQAPARIDGASTPSEETAARFADVA